MKGGVVETPASGNKNKHLNIETRMPLFVELKIVIARGRRIDAEGREARREKNNETGLRSRYQGARHRVVNEVAFGAASNSFPWRASYVPTWKRRQ